MLSNNKMPDNSIEPLDTLRPPLRPHNFSQKHEFDQLFDAFP